MLNRLWLRPALVKMTYERGVWNDSSENSECERREWETAFCSRRRVDQGYPGMSDHSSRYYSRNAGCRKSPHTPHQVEYIFLMGTVGIEGWDTVNLVERDVLLHQKGKKNQNIHVSLCNCLFIFFLPRPARGGMTSAHNSFSTFPYPPRRFSKQALGLRLKSLKAVTPQLMPSKVCFSLRWDIG